MGDHEARLEALRRILDDKAQVGGVGGVAPLSNQLGHLRHIGLGGHSQVIATGQLHSPPILETACDTGLG